MRLVPAFHSIARAVAIAALAAPATALPAQSLDGAWASEGYGYI